MASNNLIKALIFTGAFLFFVIQPLGARILLPVAGGSSQLWTSCMLFYQVAILLGYIYGHLLGRLQQKRQLVIHLLLSCAGLSVLLISPLSDAQPGSGFSQIVRTLVLCLGLPLIVIGATSPLLQYQAKNYRLYSISNAGSLAGLFLFPFVLEPLFGIATMYRMYQATYGFYVLLMGLATVALWNNQPSVNTDKEQQTPKDPTGRKSWSYEDAPRWLALAFAPSSLLLGVTAHMSQELPSFPLLWIVPLALYLVSWILAFGDYNLTISLCRKSSPLLVAVVAIILFVPVTAGGFTAHLGAFFVLSVLCHRQLFERKPPVESLTFFYLITTAGGALGGMFNTAAVLLFPSAIEYPLSICTAVWLVTTNTVSGSWKSDYLKPGMLFLLTGLTLSFLPDEIDVRGVVARLLIIFFASAVSLLFRRRKIPFALSIASVIILGFMTFQLDYTKVTLRSFYGVSRVMTVPGTNIHLLFHGSTIHGAQNLAAKDKPLYCFYDKSPIGEVIGQMKKVHSQLKIGVIGLGAGTLAAYGRSDDTIDFFEIDPAVIQLARDQNYFTYLDDSAADVRVIQGDGRKELEKVSERTYDLLVMDAFSSDAIPVHLITLEALEIYFQKLKKGGILAVNISNRHVNLQSLLVNASIRTGYTLAIRKDMSLTSDMEKSGMAPSKWAVLGKTSADVEKLNLLSVNTEWTYFDSDDSLFANHRLKIPGKTIIWTDDYSNIVRLLQ